jgi:hypothetical protein
MFQKKIAILISLPGKKSGENFANYGLLGVPTLFLLDRQGIVQKKTAMLDELLPVISRQRSSD